MVLDKLSSTLKETLKKIAKSVFVDEKLVDELIKDIQRALLAADVNVKLVFNLTKSIKERALKEKEPKGMEKREFLIKIVYEELVKFLGEEKKEIDVKKGKLKKIMMVGVYGAGKCVHSKSMISLTSGAILSAEDLYKRYNHKEKEYQDDVEIIDVEEEDIFVPSFNPKTLKIENKQVTHLWKLKGKELIKVNLDNGNDFSVRVTPEHPFFVLRQGRIQQIRADKLREDDFVAVPRRYDTKSSYVNLFDSLKELDLSVLVEPNKAKRLILSKYPTLIEAYKNLKFKRNYCSSTIKLRRGIIPLGFLDELDSNKIKLKDSRKFISFPEYLTSDLAEFLGYVIGDGHFDKRYLEISNESEEILERISYLSETLFSIKPVLRKDSRTKRMYKLRVISKTLVQILNKLFNIPIGKKGKKLRVPSQVMKSNNLCLISFLRAYFDCEAYPSRDSRSIEISSESLLLVRDINLLLLRLGIVSAISKKFVSDIPYWRLYINARYAELYAEKIRFLVKNKLRKVSNYKNVGIRQGCGKQDMIPIAGLLKETRLSTGFSISEIQDLCTSYGRYETAGLISRESLFKVKDLYLKKCGRHYNFLRDIKNGINLRLNYSSPVINSPISFYKREGIVDQESMITTKGQLLLQKSTNNSKLVDYLSLLSESDVCWLRVEGVSNYKLKEDFVYDLTVEGNHSFIADGVIVHNTTTIAKLARYYKKRGLKVAIIGLDVHRPAAMTQVEQAAKQVDVPYYIDKKEKDPVKIYKNNEKEINKYDLVLIDTSGRDALTKDLIEEIMLLNKVIKPEESLLVVSADIGQAAQKLAEGFHESCNITGIVVTKLDGTGKGGGALSSCAVVKAPIRFIGTGEKFDDLEVFNPKGFVGRLLGMGDLEALLEKAKEAIDEERAEDLGKKFLKGDFNFLDLYEQMQAMRKMGPLNKIIEMIPGMGNANIPKDMLNVQDEKLKKWKFIMQSMTKEELEEPDILTRERMDRIAKGSGATTGEVRELLKQYKQSKKLAKFMKGGDPSKLMKRMKGAKLKF